MQYKRPNSWPRISLTIGIAVGFLAAGAGGLYGQEVAPDRIEEVADRLDELAVRLAVLDLLSVAR